MSDSIRSQLLEQIELLSLPSKQLEYESALTTGAAGHAPTELVTVFCDDLYNPKNSDFIAAFSNEELKQLALLYGRVHDAFSKTPSTVSDMLKASGWRNVIALAKELHEQFQR